MSTRDALRDILAWLDPHGNNRDCNAARAALAADEGELVEALRHAVAIIRQYVPVDALGTNGQGGGDGWNDQSWPILEEYLSYMDAALARHAKE